MATYLYKLRNCINTIGLHHWWVVLHPESQVCITNVIAHSHDVCLSHSHSLSNSQNDLASLCIKAGMKNIGTMFLMTDTQMADEKFLVLVNDLLASGNSSFPSLQCAIFLQIHKCFCFETAANIRVVISVALLVNLKISMLRIEKWGRTSGWNL